MFSQACMGRLGVTRTTTLTRRWCHPRLNVQSRVWGLRAMLSRDTMFRTGSDLGLLGILTTFLTACTSLVSEYYSRAFPHIAGRCEVSQWVRSLPVGVGVPQIPLRRWRESRRPGCILKYACRTFPLHL